MVIDFHTHVFPDKIAAGTIEKLSRAAGIKPFAPGSAAGLEASMQQAGVALSVQLPVATSPAQVSSVNDKMVEANEAGNGKITHFGCMHPDFDAWHDELARIAREGIRGIKLHPVYQDVDFDDIRYLRILDRCGELGLIVVTHSGYDIGFPGRVRISPGMVLSALNEVGRVSLVLAHMGGWQSWSEAADVLPGSGVYIDTSFSLGTITPLNEQSFEGERQLLTGEEFVKIIRLFGSERVLFGTDSPWGGQKETLDAFLKLPLTPQEQDDILYKNAQKLLQF